MKDNRKISQMINLGPACERDLLLAGIKTAGQLKKIGAKKAFQRILRAKLKAGHRVTGSIHAMYLYALYGAIHNKHWNEIPEKKKQEFKTLTKQIRKTGEI